MLWLSLTTVGFLACNSGRERGRLKIDVQDMIPGCSRFINCVHPWVGLGMCINTLFGAVRWNIREMSFYIATVERDDWVQIVSGCQNTHCLAQAGLDCDGVLRCMNQGRLVRDCVPPSGHFGGRYCRDEKTLSICGDLDEDGITSEVSIDCEDLGMECIEMNRGDDILAACAYPDPDPPTGLGTKLQVSCQGTLAKLQRYGAVLYWDCGLMRATCRPGIYEDWKQHEFCESSGPACQPETMEQHCSGDLLVKWCNGNEVGYDCTGIDQVCRRIRILLADVPLCTYDTTCSPFNFEETCRDGVISYCGPQGETSVSCAQLGFAGCGSNKYSFFVSCK